MADAKAPRRAGRNMSLIWLQGLACGAVVTFAAPTALMLAVLMAPALACQVAELESGRGVTRAVALACAATALRPVWLLWQNGDRMDVAVSELFNPSTLVFGWGAGACAWAMCQVLPVILRSVWDIRAAARSKAIEAELSALKQDWDLPT
jgi:hypothetical protein